MHDQHQRADGSDDQSSQPSSDHSSWRIMFSLVGSLVLIAYKR